MIKIVIFADEQQTVRAQLQPIADRIAA